MPNSKTPANVKRRMDAANRCVQRAVDNGARRLGVLLPAATAAKLSRQQAATGKSARALIIELIENNCA